MPQFSDDTIRSMSIPDHLETRFGALEFKDGVPTAATASKLYDNLDFRHALDAYLNSFRGDSSYAIYEGFHSGY
ncbi:MAG: hypothetical protein ACOYKZ_02905 [Chlamydiia bacterium]